MQWYFTNQFIFRKILGKLRSTLLLNASKQDFKYNVIIPVFNNLNGIKRIIECNARQFKLHNCEIIIIDDGSFEKIEIDLNYENITVHRIKKNEGVARARNIGIQKSRGEYVIFLDSDDVLVGNYFENLDLRISQNNLDVLCFGANREMQERIQLG